MLPFPKKRLSRGFFLLIIAAVTSLTGVSARAGDGDESVPLPVIEAAPKVTLSEHKVTNRLGEDLVDIIVRVATRSDEPLAGARLSVTTPLIYPAPPPAGFPPGVKPAGHTEISIYQIPFKSSKRISAGEFEYQFQVSISSWKGTGTYKFALDKFYTADKKELSNEAFGVTEDKKLALEHPGSFDVDHECPHPAHLPVVRDARFENLGKGVMKATFEVSTDAPPHYVSFFDFKRHGDDPKVQSIFTFYNGDKELNVRQLRDSEWLLEATYHYDTSHFNPDLTTFWYTSIQVENEGNQAGWLSDPKTNDYKTIVVQPASVRSRIEEIETEYCQGIKRGESAQLSADQAVDLFTAYVEAYLRNSDGSKADLIEARHLPLIYSLIRTQNLPDVFTPFFAADIKKDTDSGVELARLFMSKRFRNRITDKWKVEGQERVHHELENIYSALVSKKGQGALGQVFQAYASGEIDPDMKEAVQDLLGKSDVRLPLSSKIDLKKDTVARLTSELGDDDMDTREAAFEKLKSVVYHPQMHKAASDALAQAINSDDIEVKSRARALLPLIQLRDAESDLKRICEGVLVDYRK